MYLTEGNGDNLKKKEREIKEREILKISRLSLLVVVCVGYLFPVLNTVM